MRALKLIKGMRKKRFGPYPSFSPVDVLGALWRLQQRKGRARLSNELGIGEWSTRSILKFLRKDGIVDASPMGYKLTAKGFGLLKELREHAVDIHPLPPTPLTLDKKSVGILVRGKKPARVLDVRDESVKAGAEGVTLLSFKGGRFYFIDSGDEVQSDYAAAVDEIRMKFKFQDGDILLLCFGERGLERAAWASFMKIFE